MPRRCGSIRNFWREHAHLWRGADTRLVGFVASESDGETYAVTRPGHRDLEAEMLAWHVRARHNAGEDAVIVHHCPDSDFERTLAEQGYAHEGEAARVYTYDLRAMDLLYELPYRFVVRGMTGDDDFARQAELTRAVFPGSAYTPEAHACLREAPDYDSELDVAVASPDGQHVAIACAMVDRPNRVASFGRSARIRAIESLASAARSFSRRFGVCSRQGWITPSLSLEPSHTTPIASMKRLAHSGSGRREVDRDERSVGEPVGSRT